MFLGHLVLGCLLAAGGWSVAAEPPPEPADRAAAKPVWSRKLELVTPKHGKKTVAYCSDHFALYPDKPLADPAELLPVADLVEATFAACKELKLPFDYAVPRERLPVYITDSLAEFNHLVGRPVDKDFAGIYTGDKIVMRQRAVFGDGDDLNRRIVVHEVTHHVLSDASVPLPVWLAEGLAEYVANSPYRNGRLVPDKNPVGTYLQARLGELKSYPMLHLKKLFDLSYEEWSRDAGFPARGSVYYASAYLAAYYFLRVDTDRHLKNYCEAVQEKKRVRELRKILLAPSDKELEAQFIEAYRKLGIPLEFRN